MTSLVPSRAYPGVAKQKGRPMTGFFSTRCLFFDLAVSPGSSNHLSTSGLSQSLINALRAPLDD
jgi:hypothetical protein